MKTQTEFVYMGNCQLLHDFAMSHKLLIDRSDIKIKEGANSFEELHYYPVHFECKDNVKPPNGTFFVGNFKGQYAYIIQK